MNHIGKGVFEEVKTALHESIIVFCLRKRLFRYRIQQVKDIKLISERDWRIKYGKVILFTKLRFIKL